MVVAEDISRRWVSGLPAFCSACNDSCNLSSISCVTDRPDLSAAAEIASLMDGVVRMVSAERLTSSCSRGRPAVLLLIIRPPWYLCITYAGSYCTSRHRMALNGHHRRRSEEHTSELQSLMRISYAVFCLKK